MRVRDILRTLSPNMPDTLLAAARCIRATLFGKN
jgi:hypothetical protein